MAEEVASKRLKVSPPTIGTHNGHFHADEALAVFLLRLLPAYQPSQLLRTRDPRLLETCHTVVDVGGEYSPATNRFDHHQRTFNTTFPDRATKLSAAGLVYLHFGRAIIAQRTQQPEDSREVDLLWNKIYAEFVEALDANDNGVSVYDTSALKEAGIEKKFTDHGVTLASLVGDLNDNWAEHTTEITAEQAQKEEDERFLQASELMGSSFIRKVDYYHRAWLPARTVVHEAFAARRQYDEQGRIIVFPKGSVPWKDHLYSLETAEGEEGKVLYVLYPESLQEGSKWRIQAVSVSKDSFESRKPLPEAWRGVRDEKLDEVSGIPGCVFVHASGFIGGNKSWDGAKAMATKAIEL